MKIALFKIGQIIEFSINKKYNGINYEVLSCIEMLKGKTDLTIISVEEDLENNIRTYEWFKQHYKEFDKMIVINGAVNYFGGAKNNSLPEEVYLSMNLFEKDVIYLLYDPYLPLQNIVKTALSKPFNCQYSSLDLVVQNKIHYVTQIKNISKCNFLGQKSITYFPLEKYPLFMDNSKFEPANFKNCWCDLIYGGTIRSSRREKKLIEYYFDLPDNLKSLLFGNIKLSQFKTYNGTNFPIFEKGVDRLKLKEKLRISLSTVCIGDKKYSQLDDIAQRFYESILAGHIVFIDEEYDLTKRCFTDKYLKDFLYVKNKQELIEKLNIIKSNETMFYNIVKKQKEDIIDSFDKEKYQNSFIHLIESL